MYHIVYLTTNLVNKKIYIGKQSTWNLNDGYLGSGKRLHLAISKYGKENFSRQILYYCLSKEHAAETERLIVDQWFISRKDTYNLQLGGHGGGIPGLTKCYKRSLETRQKMSESAKTRKIRSYYKPVSEETKIKISLSKKGKPGHKDSEETKKRKSEIAKNRTYTKETRQKMSESAKKRKPITEESRIKRSNSIKKLWELRKLIKHL